MRHLIILASLLLFAACETVAPPDGSKTDPFNGNWYECDTTGLHYELTFYGTNCTPTVYMNLPKGSRDTSRAIGCKPVMDTVTLTLPEFANGSIKATWHPVTLFYINAHLWGWIGTQPNVTYVSFCPNPPIQP